MLTHKISLLFSMLFLISTSALGQSDNASFAAGTSITLCGDATAFSITSDLEDPMQGASMNNYGMVVREDGKPTHQKEACTFLEKPSLKVVDGMASVQARIKCTTTGEHEISGTAECGANSQEYPTGLLFHRYHNGRWAMVVSGVCDCEYSFASYKK